MTRILAAALAAALLLAAGHAAAAVTVAPGWPRPAPGGELLPGPGDGVVVVTTVAQSATTRAYASRGALRWVQRSTFGCGNCDDGPQPAALQPDGTYGPIGVEGDDYWAVDARGLRVPGCAGVVFPDGGCIEARPVGYADAHPAFRAMRGAGAPWAVEEPSWSWYPENDEPPMVVRDSAGRIYATFAFARAPGTQQYVDLLIAIDPVARTILWERQGASGALAALPDGVLVAEGDGVTAYGADGAIRWHRALPAHVVAPAATVVDVPRGQVYVGGSVVGSSGVTAIDFATGAVRWATRPADRARLLSVGRGGRVYIAMDAPDRQGVRALRFRDGATAWQLRTGLSVRDALELASGRVAVSAGRQYAPTRADRLTVLRPG